MIPLTEKKSEPLQGVNIHDKECFILKASFSEAENDLLDEVI